MLSRRSFAAGAFAGSAAVALSSAVAARTPPARPGKRSSSVGEPISEIRYRTVEIDGIPVFYREAGTAGKPVILLLPGWPSSSAMFRDLIRELAVDYHLFAPDYPGFGCSGLPDRSRGMYTFDQLGETIAKFVDQVGITQYVLYATDFGGLVGYRVMLKSPGRMKALVAQNNPLFLGASPWFGPLLPYWKDGSPDSRGKAAEHYLTLEVVRDLYMTGVSDASRIDPEQYQSEYCFLQRPGAADVSLDLLYDIRTNGPLLKDAQDYLKAHTPPTLVVSGRNDLLFSGESQSRYREVVPGAEIQMIDSGHCALADKSDEIAERMRVFLRRIA